MKLYYATGTCSLAPHIVASEAGLPLDLERVDIRRRPHVTASGGDYEAINPNGYVPALALDDGTVLTEGVALMLYLGDLAPESGLVPPAGTKERAALTMWLTFVATELHKMFSPWLFHPEYGTQAQEVAREKLGERLGYVEHHLAQGGPFLLGETFTAADAYLVTIAGWASFAKVDLTAFPELRAFMARVQARPAVQDAMRAQGLKVAS